MDLANFQHNGIQLTGYSEGGIRTSLIWPSLGLMFDMGNTYPGQMQHDKLLITHSHLDHFAGVPYYVSQRSLRNLSPPTIYVPVEIHAQVDKILQLYSEIEDFPYKYNLIPAALGVKIDINRQYLFAPHQTYHRVPSQGYTVYERRTKLKEEYKNLSSLELRLAKESGKVIEDKIETPVLSFSGDTKIEYVLNHEDVRKSQILFLECTYVDEKRDVERARNWGHIHLDEIAHYADSFENERLVLIHFSQRYRFKEIRDYVKAKLPSHLFDRVHLFLPDRRQN